MILILFGIYYPYWEREWGGEAAEYIPRVRKLGFDALEVAAADFAGKSDGYFRDLRKTAEDNGIILTGGYGPDRSNNIATDDPAALERAFDFYKRMFSQMEIAGIHILCGALYSYWPVDMSADIDKYGDTQRSIEAMKKLADIAADHGVELNMEAVNRFEGYMINTCRECLDYVEKVDRGNVHVMLDTFHMNIEEDSITEAILAAGKRLGHFHVGEANRRPPRAGRMNWEQIGRALNSIGYDGCVVMEPFVMPGGSVGRDIHVWRDIMEDTSESSLDKTAEDSVKYLKEALKQSN